MKKLQDENPSPSWGDGYVLIFDAPNILNGRLYELIEGAGLPEKQEEALKRMISKIVWDVFGDAIKIAPETHSKIRNQFYKEKQEQSALGVSSYPELPINI